MVAPKIKETTAFLKILPERLPALQIWVFWLKCGVTGNGEVTLQFPMKFKNRNRKELVSLKEKEERLQWSMHKFHQIPAPEMLQVRRGCFQARGRETGMECEGRTAPCSPTRWLTNSPPRFREIRQTKTECRVMETRQRPQTIDKSRNKSCAKA